MREATRAAVAASIQINPSVGKLKTVKAIKSSVMNKNQSSAVITALYFQTKYHEDIYNADSLSIIQDNSSHGFLTFDFTTCTQPVEHPTVLSQPG